MDGRGGRRSQGNRSTRVEDAGSEQGKVDGEMAMAAKTLVGYRMPAEYGCLYVKKEFGWNRP